MVSRYRGAGSSAPVLYRRCLKPLLFHLDPETAHRLLLLSAPVLGRLPRICFPRPRRAPRSVAGISFPGPVGLAAGFDKTGELYPFLSRLGFGFIECGTFTWEEQAGNPRPRIFRYPAQRALVNRMGFNNPGARRARANLLRSLSRGRPVPLGINIGKSKNAADQDAADDLNRTIEVLHDLADYLVINVSSPNTPGLRAFQAVHRLRALLEAILPRIEKPLFVKLAPDLTPEETAELIPMLEKRVAGLILTNTSTDYSLLPDAPIQEGGISGQPLFEKSTQMLRFVHSRCSLPVIASGGVMDEARARAKMEAGAALLQVYTGFIYEGPLFAARLHRALLESLDPDRAGGN
ncbi:MAG: quinone-dependent dihydroorotate dehydrogenase [Spirochaetales bacterium]|nr:quinone-dependent dihydroorotate dehydrogenase [Spirochaetales bacterium]